MYGGWFSSVDYSFFLFFRMSLANPTAVGPASGYRDAVTTHIVDITGCSCSPLNSLYPIYIYYLHGVYLISNNHQ